MNKNRMEGAAREMKGKTKQITGDLTDDERMEAEGRADRATGKFQRGAGKVQDKMRDS